MIRTRNFSIKRRKYCNVPAVSSRVILVSNMAAYEPDELVLFLGGGGIRQHVQIRCLAHLTSCSMSLGVRWPERQAHHHTSL